VDDDAVKATTVDDTTVKATTAGCSIAGPMPRRVT